MSSDTPTRRFLEHRESQPTHPNVNNNGADLTAFARAVLADWPESFPDAFALQDLAIEHGLLIPRTVTAACSEACRCAVYDDFPTTCYSRSALLAGRP